MKKTVDDYLALPYTIEIVPDEVGYFARVKELEGCMTVGTSKEDALAMLDDALREWLAAALADHLEIPLPESLHEERYSGKFALRLPKSLHRKLSEAALEDGVSLNQYLVMLLSENEALTCVKRLLAKERDMGRASSTSVCFGVSEDSTAWPSGEKNESQPAGKARAR